MLAPYISMDDDFQLTFLPQCSERATSSPEMLSGTSRKRSLEDDEEDDIPVLAIRWETRQLSSSIEEDLLLSHNILKNYVSEEFELPPQKRTHLLTDRDPLLGEHQALCDTAALMRDNFITRPPDLMKPLADTLSSLT